MAVKDPKAYMKEWKLKNPGKSAAYNKKYRDKNKQKLKDYNKKWAQLNSGRITAYARAYQLAKLRAMPKWLSPEQVELINQIYVNRPKGFHVDHEVPLNGKNVCGLHVPWNLRYLPASENIKKSNKF